MDHFTTTARRYKIKLPQRLSQKYLLLTLEIYQTFMELKNYIGHYFWGALNDIGKLIYFRSDVSLRINAS